ncbi:MAG TPA: acyltransferase, partial [Povalibacter sp.]|nr:acyltransferase [Povalibacter sp.]
YLAVDFFFALSGFVVAYAYDDRWRTMTTRQFLLVRLVRLHPLLILGTLLGLASYLFDPFAGDKQQALPATLLIVTMLSLLVLPAPRLPNRWDDTHPLNGPAWTLFQEYLANIAYAFILRKLSARALAGIALCGAVALLFCALHAGSLDTGYGWGNLWGAPIRLVCPFVMGLLLYRWRDRLPRMRLGFIPLSALMAAAFAFPSLPRAGAIELNALYDFVCVAVLFPAIIVCGIHSETVAWRASLCRMSGKISYPIYVTHFPFAYVFLNLAVTQQAPIDVLIPVGLGLFAFMIAFAWVAARHWDEPIRSRLGSVLAVQTGRTVNPQVW